MQSGEDGSAGGSQDKSRYTIAAQKTKEGWLSGQKRQTVNLLPTGYVWFESHTFHKMKGEWCCGIATTYGKEVIDIVDTGNVTKINIKRCEGNPRDG